MIGDLTVVTAVDYDTLHGSWLLCEQRRHIRLYFPKAVPKAHGYATNEFEITAERLGAYLPVCQNPR